MPKDYEQRPGETFEQWFCRLNHCSHPRHCPVCAGVSR